MTSNALPAPEQHALRVLVVNPDPDIGQMLAMLLQMAGYEAVVVSDGAEALASAQTARTHAVLFECPPDGAGLAWAMQLRESAGDAPVELIAFVESADTQPPSALGVRHRLTLPFDWHAVQAILDGLNRAG